MVAVEHAIVIVITVFRGVLLPASRVSIRIGTFLYNYLILSFSSVNDCPCNGHHILFTGLMNCSHVADG